MTGERDFLVGKRVAVIGLGIEGVDAARYASNHGATTVTVIDAQPPEALATRMRQLEDLPIQYRLGQQSADDLLQSDFIFVSQSVPLAAPGLTEARERGVPVSSMMRYFLQHCPGPTIGITGSSGKTTATSLIAAMLAAGGRAYRIGGNIGTGVLGLLDEIGERTWSVLEISHTQLTLTDRSPHVAVLLNVTPNHLDKFTWDEYAALKQNIVRYQSSADHAVLNLDDDVARSSGELTPATKWYFTMGERMPDDAGGAFLRDRAIFLRRESVEELVLPVDEIPLRGEHNVANALAASATAAAVGVGVEAIAEAIRSFAPVPHRLEVVVEVGGVTYVNDSIATTPERTLAGIRAFSEPLVLLLGGKDKDLPKEELAQEALQLCHGIVFFGADGALLEAAIEASAATASFEERPTTTRVATLAEAVREAAELAEPGDVVLLSPACTSFDAYRNFEERGDEFRRLVQALAVEAR